MLPFLAFLKPLEKTSISLGTFVYVAVLQLTGRMNNSALVLTIFFIIGAVILRRVSISSSK